MDDSVIGIHVAFREKLKQMQRAVAIHIVLTDIKRKINETIYRLTFYTIWLELQTKKKSSNHLHDDNKEFRLYIWQMCNFECKYSVNVIKLATNSQDQRIHDILFYVRCVCWMWRSLRTIWTPHWTTFTWTVLRTFVFNHIERVGLCRQHTSIVSKSSNTLWHKNALARRTHWCYTNTCINANLCEPNTI